MKNSIIEEIIPKDMPDWFKQDMEDGQVFARMVKRLEAKDKLIAEWDRKYNELSDYTNKIKANAIEEARLSVVIHSPAREGTFLDGADWAFDEISKQLEDRVSELTNNKEVSDD